MQFRSLWRDGPPCVVTVIMELDTLLNQVRVADRAACAEAELGAGFRAGVLAEVRRQKAALVATGPGQWLVQAWVTLLREPRWALALLLVSFAVSLLTTQLSQRRVDERLRDRSALSLTAFETYPPYAPERLLLRGNYQDE